jgi:hypothetical protein
MCRSGPHVSIGTTELTVLAGLREEAAQSAQWSSGGRAICTFGLASKAVPGTDSVQGCCAAPREPRPNASPNQHFTPTSGSWLTPGRSLFFGAITRLAIRRGSFDSVPEVITSIRRFITGIPAETERRPKYQGGEP